MTTAAVATSAASFPVAVSCGGRVDDRNSQRGCGGDEQLGRGDHRRVILSESATSDNAGMLPFVP
jgi:hypothetical protein